MHSYAALRACLFCNRPFKSAGALTNHMEKIHPNLQDRRRKRKHVNSNSSQEETDVTQESTECITDQDLEQWLAELFSDSKIFFFQQHDCDKVLWVPCKEIIYDHEEDNRHSDLSLLDANNPTENSTIHQQKKIGVVMSHQALQCQIALSALCASQCYNLSYMWFTIQSRIISNL